MDDYEEKRRVGRAPKIFEKHFEPKRQIENRKTYTRVQSRDVSNAARLSMDVCGMKTFGLCRKTCRKMGSDARN